jgi:hypothetical protein
MATLLMPIVLLAAAEAAGPVNGPRVGDTAQDPGDAHVNRHVEAHVGAIEGGDTPNTGDDRSWRARRGTDLTRGATPTPLPVPPFAGQPLRDRRF